MPENQNVLKIIDIETFCYILKELNYYKFKPETDETFVIGFEYLKHRNSKVTDSSKLKDKIYVKHKTLKNLFPSLPEFLMLILNKKGIYIE